MALTEKYSQPGASFEAAPAGGGDDAPARHAVEQARAGERIALLAAARLAREASEALRAHGRFVGRAQQSAHAALTRIAGGVGAPAQILRDVAQEIAALRDLASAADCAFIAGGESEFCRPDVILDRVVAQASVKAGERGVAIDYIRSFSDFTMFGAPMALAVLMQVCIETAAGHCRGGVLSLRANFHDAQDGRRMLRLVIGPEAGGLSLPAAEMETLARAAQAAGGSVEVKDGAMIVMLRAPLAAPANLLAVQPDLEAHPF